MNVITSTKHFIEFKWTSRLNGWTIQLDGMNKNDHMKSKSRYQNLSAPPTQKCLNSNYTYVSCTTYHYCEKKTHFKAQCEF